MRAAAANPDAATFLGSGEADLIPQGLQKQPVGFQLQVIFFTVDEQSDLLFHESGAYLLFPIDSTYPRKNRYFVVHRELKDSRSLLEKSNRNHQYRLPRVCDMALCEPGNIAQQRRNTHVK
jgi:hypothetical protein